MLHEYAVTYGHDNGIGRMCVTRIRKINSYDELESVDELIRSITSVKNPFVVNFQLLREYEGQLKE